MALVNEILKINNLENRENSMSNNNTRLSIKNTKVKKESKRCC